MKYRAEMEIWYYRLLREKCSREALPPSMLTQGMNIKITHLLHMFFVGHLSSHLKHAICRELGFENWDELTQAALSVDA